LDLGQFSAVYASKRLEFVHIHSGGFARAEEAAEAWFRERPENMIALYARILPPLLSGDLELAEQRLATALKQLPDEPLIISQQGMLHAWRRQTDLALQCVRRALDSPRSFGTRTTPTTTLPAFMRYSGKPTRRWRGWNAA
jgi:hypothetical protein